MGSGHGLGSNAGRAARLSSLIPVAERSMTAVSRSTLRLRPRPASAPPPSGNAGSTDYGPRGCTVGPRTCAPAHLRLLLHLPTSSCGRILDSGACRRRFAASNICRRATLFDFVCLSVRLGWGLTRLLARPSLARSDLTGPDSGRTGVGTSRGPDATHTHGPPTWVAAVRACPGESRSQGRRGARLSGARVRGMGQARPTAARA